MNSSKSPRSLILVTGPTRSGKSEWAEHLATNLQQLVIYVATAQVESTDAEWQARIDRHRQRRPTEWQTWAVPIALAAAIDSAPADGCLLVDSLGTWLANVLEQEAADWEKTETDLLTTLQQVTCSVILVAEETGWGVVPAYPLGRRFRDRLGTLTRKVGAIADVVYLVTGGYALDLTQLGQRLPPG